MKLVIKLDDETYKEVMDRTEFDTLVLGIRLIEAVQNGTPLKKELKKIRTKIDALPTMSCNSVGCSYMWAKDYKIDVLSILDKSIEENK